MNETIDLNFNVPFTHFKHIFVPASFQSKLPEQRHTSSYPLYPLFKCMFIYIYIYIYSPLLGCGPNTGKWRIPGLRGTGIVGAEYMHPHE